MSYRRTLLLCLVLLLPLPSQADDRPQTREEAETYLKQQVAKLHPQHGKITLDHNLATLDLPQGFGYLPPDEASLYMREVVGYPRRLKNLGLILPLGVAIGSPVSWSALIAYREDGYVKDEGAAALDSGALMAEITQANEAYLANATKMGFGNIGISILGWAEKPAYDPATHTLIWATEIRQGESENHTLNYFIRILGRRGVLSLTIVAPLEQLPALEDGVSKIAPALTFNAPYRYADITNTDTAAAYSLTDMITGHTPSAKTAAKKK
jgi:uncharacterized membrane-anchored protein